MILPKTSAAVRARSLQRETVISAVEDCHQLPKAILSQKILTAKPLLFKQFKILDLVSCFLLHYCSQTAVQIFVHSWWDGDFTPLKLNRIEVVGSTSALALRDTERASSRFRLCPPPGQCLELSFPIFKPFSTLATVDGDTPATSLIVFSLRGRQGQQTLPLLG